MRTAKFPSRGGERMLTLCLMVSHFHLVVETPQARLAAGVPNVLSVVLIRR